MSVDRFDPAAPTPTPNPALKPEQPRASDIDQDEEERRRAGRGGGGINPANVTHSLNIRPDVVDGPAGLEVRTTIKSEDFLARQSGESDLAGAPREDRHEPSRESSGDRGPTAEANASRPPVDEFEADLAAAKGDAHDDESQREQATLRASEESAKRQNAERAARAGEDVPGDSASNEPDSFAADLRAARGHARENDPQREQATLRANEESAKHQNAERAARAGEGVPGEAASNEPDSFAADLRAAAKEAKREREGEGQEVALRDHVDTGQAPGTGGGRGIF